MPLKKLNDAIVLECRMRYYRDGESSRLLATDYGVTQPVMHRACVGTTWAHVEMPAGKRLKRSVSMRVGVDDETYDYMRAEATRRGWTITRTTWNALRAWVSQERAGKTGDLGD